jgi:Phage integrase family
MGAPEPAPHGEPTVQDIDSAQAGAEADELVDEVVLYLAWEVQQGVEKLAFGPAWHVDGGLGLERAIVTEADGTVVHPDTLLGRWKRLVKVAGVPVIPLHGARHSYAELALSSGVRLDVVSRTLGHSSSGFTADQYSHDNDEAATEAAEIVGRALRQLVGKYRGSAKGPDHRVPFVVLVDLVAGTGFEPVTSGL